LLYFHLNELPRPETGLLVLRRLKPPLSAGPGAKAGPYSASVFLSIDLGKVPASVAFEGLIYLFKLFLFPPLKGGVFSYKDIEKF
jgi:hypothetical protein